MTAVIDDRDAREQARARGLRFETTMHIIIEAYKRLDDIDREAAEQLYEALLATDMRLPRVDSVIRVGLRDGVAAGVAMGDLGEVVSAVTLRPTISTIGTVSAG